MRTVPSQIISDDPNESVVLTGPISGSVVLSDGTVVDVGDSVNRAIAVPLDQVAEVAHLIGERYAAEGHSEDPDFVYDGPGETLAADYVPHPDNTTLLAPAPEAAPAVEAVPDAPADPTA